MAERADGQGQWSQYSSQGIVGVGQTYYAQQSIANKSSNSSGANFPGSYQMSNQQQITSSRHESKDHQSNEIVNQSVQSNNHNQQLSGDFPPRPVGVISLTRVPSDVMMNTLACEQLEDFKKDLVKSFENAIVESLQKNHATANAIESMKKQLGSTQQLINDASQSVGSNKAQDLQGPFEDEAIAMQIEKTVGEMFRERIQGIEKAQTEMKIRMEQMKKDVIKEMEEGFNTIDGSDLHAGSRESFDKTIAQNVGQQKLQEKMKLAIYFEEIESKISSVEKEMESLKEAHVQPSSEAFRSEMYSKFDACVREFEGELMQLKAQIDSKLDISQLPEVAKGYQSIHDTEILNRIGSELEQLENDMKEQASESKQQQVQLDERINSLENFVDLRLREVNVKLKDQFEENQSVACHLKHQEKSILAFEKNVDFLNDAYSLLAQEIQSMQKLNEEARGHAALAIEDIATQLGEVEIHANSQVGLSSQFEMDAQMGQIDREIQMLMGQMDEFQTNLDQHVAEHSNNLQRDHSIHSDFIQPNAMSQSGDIQQQYQQHQEKQKFYQYIEQQQPQYHQPQQQQQYHLHQEKQQNISTITDHDEYLKKYEEFHKQVSSYLEHNPNCNLSIVNFTQTLISSQNGRLLNINNSSIGVILARIKKTDHNNNQPMEIQQLHQIVKKIGRSRMTFFLQNNSDQLLGQTRTTTAVDEGEVGEDTVYEMDERGYLIDNQGNYILDEKGNEIQLSAEHIDFLKSKNLIQDD